MLLRILSILAILVAVTLFSLGAISSYAFPRGPRYWDENTERYVENLSEVDLPSWVRFYKRWGDGLGLGMVMLLGLGVGGLLISTKWAREEARKESAFNAKIQRQKEILEGFYLREGRYPSEREGLEGLLEHGTPEDKQSIERLYGEHLEHLSLRL